MSQTFQLTSLAFADGDFMPELYSCKGANSSPPLSIAHVPLDTASLALIMHDPDAPNGDYTHWLLWNIPPETHEFLDNDIPRGALPGTNDFGSTRYGGPCPPSGTHRYIFELYALDRMLELTEGASERELRAEIADHLIAETTLTGLFASGTRDTAKV